MEITLKLPDDLAQHADPAREALEALVIEGYRSGALALPSEPDAETSARRI
jgi:hypothetical protein